MKKRTWMIYGMTAAMTVSTLFGAVPVSALAQETELSEMDASEEESILIKITSVDGEKIVGVKGTISTPEGGNGQPPQLPSGEMGEAPQKPEENGEAAEKPEESGSEVPQNSEENGEAAEKPEESGSEAPQNSQDGEGQMPQDGNGQMPQDGNGQPPQDGNGQPPQNGNGQPPQMSGQAQFEESDEALTFRIDDETKVTLEFLQGSGEGTLEDLAVGAVAEVVLDEDGVTAKSVLIRNLNAGGGFGGSGEVTNGSAAVTLEEDQKIQGETYSSAGDDENALRIDGAAATLEDISVEKTDGESSNTENGDFYGCNAGLLALNGAQVTIQGGTVTTDVTNGNGVFSYGEGTQVNLTDTVIRTSGRCSGGIQTTGGGTTNAENLDVETQGDSSAAIRSDRGGGVVTVNGGTYVTNGSGSPAVYSTADISVSDAQLTANASEGIVVEGKNAVRLTNCNLVSSMQESTKETGENVHGIMIYQSMSGDADLGEAYFSAEGGSLTAQTGDLFYVTNTDCEIDLTQVTLKYPEENVLLRIEGNQSSRGWGTQGANGGDVIMTMQKQEAKGTILVDEISSLDLTLSEESVLEGAINPDGQAGEVSVTMDEGTQWKLTGDSYLTEFDGDLSQIDANGYHLYVKGEERL